MLPKTDVAALLAEIAGGRQARDLEGQHIEFKSDISRSRNDTLRLVSEAAACLANGQGGLLIVGVDDRIAGPDALVGTDLTLDNTKHRIFELTDPGLVVDVQTVSHADTHLLVITVPASPTLHSVSGRCTERIADACMPMSPERIAAVITDRRGDDWSSLDSGISADAVMPVALATVRTLLESQPNPVRRRFAQETDLDLLRRLGVLGTSGSLTNAGALLMSDRLQHDQLAYVYRRTPTGALATNEHLAAPLLMSLQRVFDLIDARLERTSVNVAGGQQLQLADLPEAAVREALVNAVMHRDYRRPGRVLVEHSPTRLTVTSPGPFLSGITPENILTTSSRTRNQHLSNVVRMLGLAETAGTGVDRMYASMARIGHRPPVYSAGLDQVEVMLTGGAPNSHVARYAATLPADEADDADTMLVVLNLLTRVTINASIMAPLFQRSVDEAQTVLARLTAPPVSILEPTRQSAVRSRPEYRFRSEVVGVLGPALTYRRRSTDDYDRKVIGLVRETGHVNGRMVKLILDLDSVAASRVLGDLVTREILVKTSQAQRGPSVSYGPGPAFPHMEALHPGE